MLRVSHLPPAPAVRGGSRVRGGLRVQGSGFRA